MLRKTKIICSLGPATDKAEEIRNLIEAGANIFRLNMSHARHDWTREVVSTIRAESGGLGIEVALLVDMQGPAIRTGTLDKPLQLRAGDRVEFTIGDARPKEKFSTSVNYSGLAADVSIGDTMLVDNGVLHLKIVSTDSKRVIGETQTGGELGSRRHINLPGVRVNLPAFSDKDREDLDLALDLDVDFVAMSFVRDADHVEELRELLRKKKAHARIVAKIEDQEAVRNLDEIVRATDVVMVARGDLGIEVNLEELPILQRLIVKRCLALGRRVIVATHLLESMIANPIPTRAEVTDVANAVFEEADALMLSGETSIGQYPVKSVRTLDVIARRIERSGGAGYAERARLETAKQKSVRSAVSLANSIDGSKILVFTSRGVMANYVAHLRPRKAPIFSFSPDERVCRALLINRAVVPFHLEFAEQPEDTVAAAIALLAEREFLVKGDPVVILSDVFAGDHDVDTILLQKA